MITYILVRDSLVSLCLKSEEMKKIKKSGLNIDMTNSIVFAFVGIIKFHLKLFSKTIYTVVIYVSADFQASEYFVCSKRCPN